MLVALDEFDTTQQELIFRQLLKTPDETFTVDGLVNHHHVLGFVDRLAAHVLITHLLDDVSGLGFDLARKRNPRIRVAVPNELRNRLDRKCRLVVQKSLAQCLQRGQIGRDEHS